MASTLDGCAAKAPSKVSVKGLEITPQQLNVLVREHLTSEISVVKIVELSELCLSIPINACRLEDARMRTEARSSSILMMSMKPAADETTEMPMPA